MNLNVVNPKKYNCFEFKAGESYEIVAVKKSYILMRLGKDFIPLKLSKKECKHVFNMTSSYYELLYNNY